jgi:formylglycine-generating enzyme required for sulfatase activity
MGGAGGLNDNADIPAPVFSYKANAFGLYNMAGNVSEWVMDTYRPMTYDQEEFRPFRGNVFDQYRRITEDNSLEEKDSLGNLTKRLMTAEELTAKRNQNFMVNDPDARDYIDGDSTFVYDFGRTTLVNNDSRVIKGGSWADRAYWLSPGARRYQQANLGSSTVGFRLVMDRLGSPDGNNGKGSGNYFTGRK